ncbi:MAG: phosphoglycerate dehydrogenase [Bacteroidales bacterium]
MNKILTLNKIDEEGLNLLRKDKFEVGDNIQDADGILVRSAKLHDMEFSPNLKAVARAGAGTNNIPSDNLTERGVVVFNTPGANAEAVKELVISGLLMASRGISESLYWANTIKDKGDAIPSLIEEYKKNFKGQEIRNRTLGVIGLGAIGLLVANAAQALGMKVVGYDPYISVQHAWRLSRNVKAAKSLDSLLSKAEYISLHIPLLDSTLHTVNEDFISKCKEGVKILNFSRGELVDNTAMRSALESKKVAKYITDFPNKETLAMERCVNLPHLGASTSESETNCAIMAVEQIKDFLENGNIKNSVNFPDAELERNGYARLVIANRNIPNMVGQITSVLAKDNINIENMLNKNKKDLAYNIIDIGQKDISEKVLDDIRNIEGVLMARFIR